MWCILRVSQEEEKGKAVQPCGDFRSQSKGEPPTTGPTRSASSSSPGESPLIKASLYSLETMTLGDTESRGVLQSNQSCTSLPESCDVTVRAGNCPWWERAHTGGTGPRTHHDACGWPTVARAELSWCQVLRNHLMSAGGFQGGQGKWATKN